MMKDIFVPYFSRKIQSEIIQLPAVLERKNRRREASDFANST